MKINYKSFTLKFSQQDGFRQLNLELEQLGQLGWDAYAIDILRSTGGTTIATIFAKRVVLEKDDTEFVYNRYATVKKIKDGDLLKIMEAAEKRDKDEDVIIRRLCNTLLEYAESGGVM